MSRPLACVALALLPPALALAGVAIDERLHAGYSTWLSACRAAGPSLPSVVSFTLALLPTGVIGMLTGGLVVLSLGVLLRRDACAAQASLSAHLGCVAGMGAGLLLCTLMLPLPLMLVSDALLAGGVAAFLFSHSRARTSSASVKSPTGALTSAQ